MKKKIILLLIISLLFITGCTSKLNFEEVKEDTNSFHKMYAAEKIAGGIVYFDNQNVVYEKAGTITIITDYVEEVWLENEDLYYTKNNILYNYNLKTKQEEKITSKPHRILGKYNDAIISYSGKNIYAIKNNKKEKIFADGYYLNRAILYKNKVYGIPSHNVYEYNLDTLNTKKITDNPEYIQMQKVANELYITEGKKINKKKDNLNFTYSKVTDQGLQKVMTIKNKNMINAEKFVKDGLFLSTIDSQKDINGKGRLYFFKNGKLKTIDKGYYYEIIAIYNGKMYFYKNRYNYGTYDKNLNSIYYYDGNNVHKAFTLDLDNYEAINGYPYEDGLLITLSYESNTNLYNYDGHQIKELPVNVYSIHELKVIDNKIYMRYSEGEESFNSLGKVMSLD